MLGSAVFEAIAHFTQAREMLLSQEQTGRRDEHELELLKMTGSACIAAYGYGAPETIAAFDTGLALAEHIDRPDLLFPILYGQYVYRYIQGGWHRGRLWRGAANPGGIRTTRRFCSQDGRTPLCGG